MSFHSGVFRSLLVGADALGVVQKMKMVPTTLIMVILCLLASIITIILWPFAIAGAIALLIGGIKFNRWIVFVTTVALVAIWRLMLGEWIFRIGGSPYQNWYYELLPGLLSMTIAYILITGFSLWPSKFIEGFRSTSNAKPQHR